MENAIAMTEEILLQEETILSKIPYANVQEELKGYFEAVESKLETDKRTLAKKRVELGR